MKKMVADFRLEDESDDEVWQELHASADDEFFESEGERLIDADLRIQRDDEQMSEGDEGFYDEDNLNMLVDDDEISDAEEGFMRGWLDEGDDFE